MKYENLKRYDETVLTRLYELEEKFKTGIINHFHAYVSRVSPNAIAIQSGEMFVLSGLISEEYINKYLCKTESDFSAKDCAVLAINRVGIPHKDEMSVDSLEKHIRKVIANDYREKAYGKHVKGKKNVVCVDWETACSIASSETVKEYVWNQIGTAERREGHKDAIAWRAYELEKKKIEYLSSLNFKEDDSDSYTPFKLSDEQKKNLMVEAIFKSLFSEFDFAKYESYREEMEILDENWDFGKRYQELEEIFTAQDYNGEFYKVKPDNAFLDALAEKIAEKIIKKTVENGNSK